MVTERTTISYTLPDDTYVHIAAVMDGNKFRVFVDGVRVVDETIGTILVTTPLINTRFQYMEVISNGVSGGNDQFYDSFRMHTEGLYTVDFTPPTSQFSFP